MVHHPGSPAVAGADGPRSARGLAKVLRVVSVFTLLMTVPQVVIVWSGPAPRGVSLLSWGAYLLAACLWLVYGIQKRDKTIYLACVGWILLDLAVVIGVFVRR